MNLGGTYTRGSTIPQSAKTDNQLLIEQNKNLRKLNETLCCLIQQGGGANGSGTDTQLLTDIKTILTQIELIGKDCSTPSSVKLCELQQILDKLNEIKIQINGDDIAINLNLDQLESLVTQTNTLLTNLSTQLTQPNTNHVVVDNIPIVEYQVKDCQNNNVGAPQEVVPSIVLNKVTASICNTDELAAAINGTPKTLYNNVKHQETTSTPIIIPANSVHSISYKILEGIVDITIGSDTLSYIQGEADMEEVDTLIIQEYTFTPQPGGKVKIKTIF